MNKKPERIKTIMYDYNSNYDQIEERRIRSEEYLRRNGYTPDDTNIWHKDQALSPEKWIDPNTGQIHSW